MKDQFLFEEQQFNRLFPFYIRTSNSLVVVNYGKSLQKIFTNRGSIPFVASYAIKRPLTTTLAFGFLKTISGQQVIIECVNDTKVKLRGQVEYLLETDEILFIGSPWFGSTEDVIDSNLTLDDFAYHDRMIDLLHVLKSQETTANDLAKTKQNFLANMSHEIRTPINAIMGIANQLGKTKLDSTQQFYLNTINSATDNLLII